MKYDIISKEDKKIGIFTDIHVGVSADSKLRLNETQKCIKWIIQKFKAENVDWVIFCGDLFNSRYSINVNTLNIGIELIEDLAYNFEKVFLIEGNHDTYYKNSNSVNSVKFLQKISKNDNIYVIDEYPLFLKIHDKTFGLYPWAYCPEMTNEIDNFEVPDYGFGHFELNGMEQTSGVSSCSKFELKDMFAMGNMIFSGHYHVNKIYKECELNKLLYMVGSPLQLDWGDYGREKKIVILNTSDGKMKECKNTKNAEFRKVFYSEFENGKYSEDDLKTICYHNFIKFVIDKQYKFENILRFSDLIKKTDPYSLELDYLISMANGEINSSTDEIIKTSSKTNKDYLIEYVRKVYPEYKKIDENIELDYLEKLAINYYDKSQMLEKDREEKELVNESV